MVKLAIACYNARFCILRICILFFSIFKNFENCTKSNKRIAVNTQSYLLPRICIFFFLSYLDEISNTLLPFNKQLLQHFCTNLIKQKSGLSITMENRNRNFGKNFGKKMMTSSRPPLHALFKTPYNVSLVFTTFQQVHSGSLQSIAVHCGPLRYLVGPVIY